MSRREESFICWDLQNETEYNIGGLTFRWVDRLPKNEDKFIQVFRNLLVKTKEKSKTLIKWLKVEIQSKQWSRDPRIDSIYESN